MSTNYFLRVEGRARGSLERGVAARVYDPAWMLARQWQLGELSGEDSGTPIRIELEAETARLTRWRAAGAASLSRYDPAARPLEALVEAEPLRDAAWTARMRVDAGREFLQALRDAGASAWAGAYVATYSIARANEADRAADPAGARLVDVAADRLPDGESLYRSMTASIAGDRLPDDPPVSAAGADAVLTAARAWLAWCSASLFETDDSAWNAERLEYGFAVATSDDAGATMLEAGEYRGGRVDWCSFDARGVSAPTGFKALDPIDVLPTTVRFRGMPNARWWEFEDASIDMGAVDAGASDLARLALLEFAIVYGNDFFAVPLRLPIGSLTRVRSLTVTDTFGMRLVVDSAARGQQRVGADRWTMFTLTETGSAGGDDVADVLFLPSSVGSLLAGETVEDVFLARDEMANLAWAIERSYEGGTGVANARAEAAARAIPESDSPSADAMLAYRFGTSVPPHWFALVPRGIGGKVRFDLQVLANQMANPEAVPKGRFLDLNGPAIHEEEVPREGARLSRDYVMTRWVDGSTLTWSRRRKRVGKGEGSSGLRFDVAEFVPKP